MRHFLSLAAFLLGSAAHADDLLLRADVASATLYLSGAEITRRGTVEIPQGDHRLLIALPDAAQADRFVVSGPEGLSLGQSERIAGHAVAEGALDDAEQATARAAVDAAEAALQQAEDEVAAANGAIQGLEAQARYLASLAEGGADGAAMPDDPALLSQVLATLGSETARVQADLQSARIARRDLVLAAAEAQATLTSAADTLAQLQPFGTTLDVVAIPVRSDGMTEAEIRVDYLSYGAGWEPGYEIRLDSESGAMTVDRFVSVFVPGPARWRDVEMTFSTAEPDRRRSPATLSPTPARLIEPPPIGTRAGDGANLSAIEDLGPEAPRPVMEAAVADDLAALQIDGLSVSYEYARPVSIGVSGEAVLPLESLSLDAETEAHAVPRHDETAFLVARATNDSGEPILPGLARFYRDGALVGEDILPLITNGAEAELAFGPIDHLRLVWIDRSLAEGDRGVFTTSNTQARRIAFGVENTSDRAEIVHLFYATPFSEQEDLDLDLSLSPAPDERDVDDRRGVHGWTLDIAPGATDLVEMEVGFDWPEGQILTWRP